MNIYIYTYKYIVRLYPSFIYHEYHIEIKLNVYKLFETVPKWSPAPPHPHLGKQKLPRGKTLNILLMVCIYLLSKYHKKGPKMIPRPLPIPDKLPRGKTKQKRHFGLFSHFLFLEI